MNTAHKKIKVLHLEDQQTDADQISWLLGKSGMSFEVMVVDSKQLFEKALVNFHPDVILSDHSLPSFDSMEALSMVKSSGHLIPFILLTGTVSDEFAINAMREGADDYLLKDRPQRLSTAILNAIEKYRLQKEKWETDQKIRNTEKQYADLIQHLPASIAILDKNGIIVEVNSCFLKLFGKKNVVGKTVPQVFPEIEGAVILDLLDSVYRTGRSFLGKELLLKIDTKGNGKPENLYLNFLYKPFFDIEGNVQGLYYFGVDVTEQVVSRKKIEETEQRYRQIVETAQEGIWVIDENERTTFVNTKLCELLEYTPEEMIGKQISFFMDEEGKQLSSHAIRERKKGLAGRARLKYISKTKRQLWTNVAANPLFDEGGNYKGALAMITDITDQKKIEEENEKLATVASLTVNAVIVTDAEGRINWVNKGFERITEYSFDEVMGKKPGDFLQGLATDSSTVLRMSECIKRGDGFREEVLNYGKSGRQYWLDIEVVPLRDSNNNLTGFMAIEQDITDRKKSEQETLTLIDNLQKKNKDLQQFSYIVSHNLRAPIAKLMGLASIIKTENEQNKFLIEKVAEESASLDEVVKDINLIVSARKSDKERMENIFFETETLHVMQVLETEIEESKAVISYDFSENKGILTIKSYVYSILYNLISNAIKYAQPNHPPVIRIQSQENEKNICLFVKDNGRGIDLEKNKNKIFGLYKRFHGNEIPGKGVGLHLVKIHAESLGGSVEVQSKLNEGTEFKIYLPKNYGKIKNN